MLCRFPVHGKRGRVELQGRLSKPSCTPTALPEGLCDADTHRGTCLLSLLVIVHVQMDHEQRTIAGQTCQWCRRFLKSPLFCPRKPCITEQEVIYSSSRHAKDGFVTVGGTRFAAFLQKPLTNFKQYGIVVFAVTKRRQA